MRKDDDDGVKKCMDLKVEGTAGDPRKTWIKTVEDMKLKRLKVEDCANRPKWKKGVKRLPQEPEESD